MFFHMRLIHTLLSFVLVINGKISLASSDENNTIPNHVDILNTLLSNPGWKRIVDIKVQHKNRLVSGKDIVASRFDLNVDYDEHFKSNYDMTVKLLACVYADVMFKLVHFLENIVLISSLERRRVRDKAYNKHKRPCLIKRKQIAKDVVDDVGGQTDEMGNNSAYSPVSNGATERVHQSYKRAVDYKLAWDILHFALDKLKGTRRAFAYMYGAISYLVDLIPYRKSIDPQTQNTIKINIVWCAGVFEDISKDIKLLLPDYVDENDAHYNRYAGKFSERALKFFKRHTDTYLTPFMKGNCVPSCPTNCPTVRELIGYYKEGVGKITDKEYAEKKQTKISNILREFGIQIDNLAKDVAENFYSELGFVYDEENHTTSVSGR